MPTATREMSPEAVEAIKGLLEEREPLVWLPMRTVQDTMNLDEEDAFDLFDEIRATHRFLTIKPPRDVAKFLPDVMFVAYSEQDVYDRGLAWADTRLTKKRHGPEFDAEFFLRMRYRKAESDARSRIRVVRESDVYADGFFDFRLDGISNDGDRRRHPAVKELILMGDGLPEWRPELEYLYFDLDDEPEDRKRSRYSSCRVCHGRALQGLQYCLACASYGAEAEEYDRVPSGDWYEIPENAELLAESDAELAEIECYKRSLIAKTAVNFLVRQSLERWNAYSAPEKRPACSGSTLLQRRQSSFR